MTRYFKRLNRVVVDPETYSTFFAAAAVVAGIITASLLAVLALFGAVVAVVHLAAIHWVLAVAMGLVSLLVPFILILAAFDGDDE